MDRTRATNPRACRRRVARSTMIGAAVATLVALLVASCSGSPLSRASDAGGAAGSGASPGSAPADMPTSTSATGSSANDPSVGASSTAPTAMGPNVIRTGQLSITVRAAGTTGAADAVDSAAETASAQAIALGGQVVSDQRRHGSGGDQPCLLSVYPVDVSGPTGSSAAASPPAGNGDGPACALLVLSVPPAALDQAMADSAALGTVSSRAESAVDVTSQVVDGTSRVATLQASVDRIRALMAQAQSIADIVSIESELTTRQADLESLQAQLRTLAAQTAMAELTLRLYRGGDAAVQSSESRTALSELTASVHRLGRNAADALVLAGGAAPYAVLALVLLLVAVLARRRVGRRRAAQASGLDVADEAGQEQRAAVT
jgi:hypothetical protein